jgi:hypothetical protein
MYTKLLSCFNFSLCGTNMNPDFHVLYMWYFSRVIYGQGEFYEII